MIPEKILRFKTDTKHRKEWFTGMSFSHPAKMSLPLQLWIIENYTKAGETILDPMAGSGTILVACSLGRNVVAVELEQKFIDIMNGNWQKIKQRGPQLGSKMGDCQIIQGDARQLEGLFDKIVTSPPFASQYRQDTEERMPKMQGKRITQGGDFKEYEPNDNSSNIGNLPYGQIDKIVTSPPFAGNKGGLRSAESFTYGDDPVGKRMMGGIKGGTGSHPDNIDNLPYGNIDSIITSPPYEQSLDRWAGDKRNPLMEDKKLHAMPKEFDSIITSPPYEGSIGHGGKDNREIYRTKSLALHGGSGYGGRTGANIGDLKGDTYLEAMLTVYRQCYKVLKPCVKRCGCGIIEAEVKDGQTLSSGVLRRRGLCSVDWQGSEVDSGAEIKRSPEPNQGLLGESGLPEHIPLQSEIQIHPTQRQQRRGIQNSSSELTGHQDNSEQLDAISDSEKGSRNQDTTGDRQEAPTYGETERGRRNDAEESRAVVNQDREVLPLLQPQDTTNSSQERDAETCPKCHQKIRYEGGLLILVTKNFIRNKQVIRLDLDTISLCEQAGFTYQDRYYRKLPAQSFWRIIQLTKCEHRRGNKQNPKCALGMECPILPTKYLVPYLLGMGPEKRSDEVERIEKLCPKYINTSPKLDYEDVLVLKK